MRRVMRPLHLTRFTALRYVVADLNDIEKGHAGRHLKSCTACREKLEEMAELDELLRSERHVLEEPLEGGTAPSDPFRLRPEPPLKLASSLGLSSREIVGRATKASDEALNLQRPLIEAALAGVGVVERLAPLRLDEIAYRFALGYALEDATRRMVEAPVRWRAFAEAALARLQEEPYRPHSRFSRGEMSEAEYAFPLSHLFGWAHLVAGQALNWSADYERGGQHLEKAWRFFGEGKGSESDLACVELQESQRRTFLGRAEEALALAERASRTFRAFRLEELAARARLVKGLALITLSRDEEALVEFREALPALQKHGLWNTYVTALNNIGVALEHLGRLEEARAEYARALRRVSRTERPSVHAFIRYNLAKVLFSGGRFAEAARGFAGAASLFEDAGAPADALLAHLYLIESRARCGETRAATALLQTFAAKVQRHEALDPSALSALEKALRGGEADFERLSTLREEAARDIQQRLAPRAG